MEVSYNIYQLRKDLYVLEILNSIDSNKQIEELKRFKISVKLTEAYRIIQ